MYDIFLPSLYPLMNFFLNHANTNIVNCHTHTHTYIFPFKKYRFLGIMKENIRTKGAYRKTSPRKRATKTSYTGKGSNPKE